MQRIRSKRNPIIHSYQWFLVRTEAVYIINLLAWIKSVKFYSAREVFWYNGSVLGKEIISLQY